MVLEMISNFPGAQEQNDEIKDTIVNLLAVRENNINKLKLLNVKGFGGINMFKKKPAFKRPVF